MDNGKLRIDNIFNGKTFFSIPDYQRSYAWEEKQLRDFFEDYMNNYNSQEYYYGTILLQMTKKDKKEFCDIVDGQQRFTTLIIFMKCLISRLSSIEYDGTAMLYKHFIKNGDLCILKLQADDNDFFSTVILDDKKASETKTPAQKRLLYAKAFFEDKIKCCSDEQIEELLDRVCSTNVLIYLIQDSIEAAMIFETTNDRGKSLTNLEKTKSFLMYKASLCLDEPEQILGKIQSRFSEVYRDFESMISLNIGVDENSVLQYNYIAYEKWKTDSSIKEYTRYMEYFKNTVEELARNSNGAKEDKPLLSDYIENYTYNVQQSFSAYKSMYEGRYLEFMDIIALFRVYVIFDKMANKLQSKWYSLARDFDGNFKNASDEIIAMIKDVESDDAFIQALTAPDFCTKYSSPEKNYFYWKYENYLRRTEQPVATPMTHEDLRQKENKKLVMTIEHIVAQSNSGEKSKVITDALKIDVGSVEVFDEKYLNSIGNLTLDPQSANSSKGKKDVDEKNSKYFAKAPYKCQNELEEFMIDDVWTLESIKKRKAKLLTFAKELWCNFDFVKVLRV